MIAGEKQTNHENQKKNLPKGNTISPAPKNKTEISNSFLHRIFSLLKKEELI
jgi:DNA-binding IscR family transcriptional regulator